MKIKIFFSILFVALFSVTSAQSKEKIKGNREVTINQTYLDDFETLIIRNNFEVNIVYNSKPSVEIETDSNLHDAINVSLSEGTLTISTNYRITSKKKLAITVNFGDTLKAIKLYDKAELRSLTSMEIADLDLVTLESSRAYLNVRSSNFMYSSSGKSKSRLNVVADSSNFVLNDNTSLEALIKSRTTKFDVYQRADASIEGNSEQTYLRIDNSSNFNGKNFITKKAELLIENNSNATVNIEESLSIDASGTSETYIYGDPKIDLNTFADKAKLQKKDINDKGLF